MQGKGYWWASLRHGGLLIAPARLIEYFPDDVPPPPLSGYHVEQLRRLLVKPNAGSELLTLVLERILGLNPTTGGTWNKQPDASFSQKALTGEMVRPRRVWNGPNGGSLPVFVDDTPRLGIGRGRRAVSRVTEWLRVTGHPVALLTNHQQWRLVAAGLDWDAWAESDVTLWFTEGKPGPQVEALRRLLGPKALTPEKTDDPSPLVAAIQASRRGQAELSAELGERVRRAVELLIQSHGEALAGAGAAPRDIYLAATRTVMRMVVALFAEARDLLPRDNPIYHGAYGLQGLRESLERVGSDERLQHRRSAWPRVIALFSLVYHGSHHPLLTVPRYGGGLFTPGKDEAEGVSRALAVFEDPENSPTDSVVHQLLTLLCKSRVKVRQGGGSVWVPTPVDFSDLSSEYIGILYEGLLDYELRQAEEPIVFVAIGDEPALPLSRLEGMDDKTLTALLKEFKKKNKTAGAEEEDGAAEAEESEAELDEDEAEEDAESDEPAPEEEEVLSADDARKAARDRARQWALRAVQADGKKPNARRRTATQLALGDDPQVVKAADALLRRIVLPGEWFLVRWGGTRKGAGTFYTRPGLAVPTVLRTLRPLAQEGEAADSPPRSPETILDLKACDPSMGSGSFLVAALRYLADTLFASLFHHGWLIRDEEKNRLTAPDAEQRPAWFTETVSGLPHDADTAEAQIRARLKRHVVERCLYGVDYDPLAVELGRLALWVETMDKELPFEFLDHKLQNGNALVGCWFDRFRDYPALAWVRQTGDKATDRTLKKYVEETIRPALAKWVTGQTSSDDLFAAQKPEAVHAAARDAIKGIHAASLWEVSEQENLYQKLVTDEAQTALRRAFDTWCALWFWPADQIDAAPLPGAATAFDETVAALVDKHRFFHWELAFPDVFVRSGSGFDAILGNPPWEVQKPNSLEFFSSVDPIYRAYGKQEALKHQQEFFTADKQIERDWQTYNANLKALSNWVKHSGHPFGDPEAGAGKFSFGPKSFNDSVHGGWRQRRTNRIGFADPCHPFVYQGSADVNTYKLFLELAHTLVKDDGRIGMIVPSSIYTDKGTTELRRLFLSRSHWEWIFSMDNKEGIFSIHRSSKFCIIIINRGGQTKEIRTAFMMRKISEWEQAEKHTFNYPTTLIRRFSPSLHALLEIRNEHDRRILETLCDNGVTLRDSTQRGWELKSSQEFHMANDSDLFPPVDEWAARGYTRDEYGRWLKIFQTCAVIDREGIIRLDDGNFVDESDIESVALPLYQGGMIHFFDSFYAGYGGGSGKSIKWNKIGWSGKLIQPQYLISHNDSRGGYINSVRLAMRYIANPTNQRSWISCLLPPYPSGHTISILSSPHRDHIRVLHCSSAINSFCADWYLRQSIGGTGGVTALDPSKIENIPLAKPEVHNIQIFGFITARLSCANAVYSETWLRLRKLIPEIGRIPWRKLWGITDYERLRLRCILDAGVAFLYSLDFDDLAWILRDCDHPVEQSNSNTFSRQLDPKGFWRVDKEKHPELRHTVLTLAAFADLLTRMDTAGSRDEALVAFCSDPEQGGWDLPATLRLADLGLGHYDRAQHPQPVRAAFGSRFYDWQLTEDAATSWAECERHARNLLGKEGYAELQRELSGEGILPPTIADQRGQTSLFGGQSALSL